VFEGALGVADGDGGARFEHHRRTLRSLRHLHRIDHLVVQDDGEHAVAAHEGEEEGAKLPAALAADDGAALTTTLAPQSRRVRRRRRRSSSSLCGEARTLASSRLRDAQRVLMHGLLRLGPGGGAGIGRVHGGRALVKDAEHSVRARTRGDGSLDGRRWCVMFRRRVCVHTYGSILDRICTIH
jgi:hypothetical protein